MSLGTIEETPESCVCQTCGNACYHKPGWFLPGEAEKVAKFLGLSLKQLFKKYLAVDWWSAGKEIDLLSPTVVPFSQDDHILRKLEQAGDSGSELAKTIRERPLRVKGLKGLLELENIMFTSGAPGTRFRWTPTGRCVFLENDRCTIHPVKPYECRTGFHDHKKVKGRLSHRQVALKWRPKKWQKQCQDLLDSKSLDSATNAGRAERNTSLEKNVSIQKESQSSTSSLFVPRRSHGRE